MNHFQSSYLSAIKIKKQMRVSRRSILKYSMIGILILLCAPLIIVHLLEGTLMGHRDSARQLFGVRSIEYNEGYLAVDDHRIHWVGSGDSDASDLIFFLHGAPGSWLDFSKYMVDSLLRQHYYMVAVDRPGYGLSEEGGSEVSIIEQSYLMRQILSQYDSVTSITVVGYSYGGPIAAALSRDASLSVSRLLMLSPVNDPDCEPYFWFNTFLGFRFVRWMTPSYVIVANNEKMGHAAALQQISDIWSSIDVPTIHIHSQQDWIAPFGCNTDHSIAHIDSTVLDLVVLSGDAHFLPNSKLEMVRSYILSPSRD